MVTKASNTVFNIKQVPASFAQANAAFTSANNVAPQVQPSFDKANAAYIHANAAFQSANNVAPQVQPAFDKANAAFAAANSVNVYDANTNSTGFFGVPQGTTAQRPASPANGSIRFNTTTGAGEMYFSSNGWVTFAGEPVITDVTPTTFNGTSGTAFNIYGYRLNPDAQIWFLSSNGAQYLAGSVSYFSPTLIVATTPKNFTVAEEPLSVKLVQGSGTYIKTNVIDCGGVPSWITTAGGLGTIFGVNTVNVYVSASDPEGNAITYSIRSGSLPGGLSLRSANGLIQGLANSVLTNTTYNFTITASDSVNETDRAFSYLILNRVPVFNTASSLSNITDSMLDNYSANVTVNAYDPDGGTITYSLASGSVPTGFTFNTSNATLLLTNANTAEVTTNTTSTFTVSATDVGSGVETRQFTLVVEPPIDADFPNTVLLLSAVDSNTVLKDASSNNLNIIPFADAKASNFSPYNTSWSILFNNSNSDGIQLGTTIFNNLPSAFTFEAWISPTRWGPSATEYYNTCIFGKSSTYMNFGLNSTGKLQLYHYDGSPRFAASTGTVPLNTWTHVAAVVSGGIITFYLNGTASGTSTWYGLDPAHLNGADTFGYTPDTNGGSNRFFGGYISNARFTKSAVYTGNFTPSVTPLTNSVGETNSIFLIAQSNRFNDNSVSPITFTSFSGSPRISGWSPFAETDSNTGSVYLDGTGDYVSWTPRESFGSSDFTAETWFYITNPSSGGLDLFSLNANEGGSIASARLIVNANSLYMLASTSGSNWEINAQNLSPTIPAYQWNHVSLNRVGSSWSIYLNGNKTGATQTLAGSLYNGNKSSIGYNNFSPSPIHTPGYFSDFRLSIGNAVYTANTTVPTAPLSNTANTKVLTLQNRQPHNNHGFIDDSNTKHLLTKSGSLTQGTFSPFSADAGKWSVYLNGSSTFSIASNTALNILAYDTLECWVYMTVLGTNDLIVGRDSSYWLGYNHASLGGAANKFVFGIYNGTSWQAVSSTTSPVVGKWYHILGVKDNTTLRFYVNGVQENTSTFSGTPNNGAAFWVGSNQNGENLEGYVSNARLITGASNAIFPYAGLTTGSSFTVPSSPLTAVSGTQVLTSQSNRFVDNSPNAFAISRTSIPTVLPFSPFTPNAIYSTANTGGSLYIPGSGFVRAAASPNFNFGSNNWTMEFWLYALSYPSNFPRPGGFAYEGTPTDSAPGFFFSTSQNGTDMYYREKNNGDRLIAINAPTRAWWHLAIVRDGNTLRLYRDGVQIDSWASPATTYYNNNPFTIGNSSQASPAEPWNGYITGVRVVNGTCMYPNGTTFTPSIPRNVANTVFLFNGTYSSIIDYSGENNIETVGDAKANNIITRFAPSSVSFDGTGDYGKIPNNVAFGFLTSDFTIEGWIRANSYASGGSAYQTIFATSAFTGSGLGVKIQDAGGIATTGCINVWTGNSQIISGTSNVVDGNWHHFAISRSGTSLRLFVDGVLQTTVTNSTSFAAPSGIYPLIGSDDGTNGSFNGAISDLRVTRTARYTANFTPRPRKLPRR